MKIIVCNKTVGEVVELVDCKSCHDNTPYINLNDKIIKVRWYDVDMKRFAHENAIIFNQKEAVETEIYPYRISDFSNDMKRGFKLHIINVDENILLEKLLE